MTEGSAADSRTPASAAPGVPVRAPGAGAVQVRPQTLQAMAARGRLLRAELDSLGFSVVRTAAHTDGALPGSSVAAAVRSAVQRYRDLLDAESRRLDALVESLARSATAYTNTDAGAAASLTPRRRPR